MRLDQKVYVDQLNALKKELAHGEDIAHRKADEILLTALRDAGLEEIADAWINADNRVGFNYYD